MSIDLDEAFFYVSFIYGPAAVVGSQHLQVPHLSLDGEKELKLEKAKFPLVFLRIRLTKKRRWKEPHSYQVFVEKGEGLAGVVLVVLILDERAPDEAAVGAQRRVFWPSDVNHDLITVASAGWGQWDERPFANFSDCCARAGCAIMLGCVQPPGRLGCCERLFALQRPTKKTQDERHKSSSNYHHSGDTHSPAQPPTHSLWSSSTCQDTVSCSQCRWAARPSGCPPRRHSPAARSRGGQKPDLWPLRWSPSAASAQWSSRSGRGSLRGCWLLRERTFIFRWQDWTGNLGCHSSLSYAATHRRLIPVCQNVVKSRRTG